MSRFSGSTRGRFATRTRAAHPLRLLCGAVVVAGCLLLGCSLAPVVAVPQMESAAYDDCTLAAENYCDLVIGAGEDDRESCVAKYAFQCISGVSE